MSALKNCQSFWREKKKSDGRPAWKARWTAPQAAQGPGTVLERKVGCGGRRGSRWIGRKPCGGAGWSARPADVSGDGRHGASGGTDVAAG